MELEDKQNLLDYLKEFAKDERYEKFLNVVNSRTRHLTIVLEDIFQSQNASAVLRSCECMGIQDVHVIENTHQFETHPDIALGANKWLNIQQYNAVDENNTLKAIKALKAKGYKIVATTPHSDDVILDELPVNDKIALLFGTEYTGLSDDAIEHADIYMRIPMFGFTESYNISVSAALCIYTLMDRIRNSAVSWQLTEEERVDILIEWLKRSIRMSEKILENWQKKIPH